MWCSRLTKITAMTTCILVATPLCAFGQEVVVCDGSDVTDQVRRFIEATPPATSEAFSFLNGREGGSYLLFTEGECVISDPLKICNKRGLRIEGSGRGKTVLVWEPSVSTLYPEGPLFWLQNSAGIHFAHFSVCIGGPGGVVTTLESAIDMYNACYDCEVRSGGKTYEHCQLFAGDADATPVQPSPTTTVYDGYEINEQPQSRLNSFDDIEIAACGGADSALENGIRVRMHPDLQLQDVGSGWTGRQINDCTHDDVGVDDDCWNHGHTFTNVHVSEFRDSAFVVEGRMAFAISFYDCHCDGSYDDGIIQNYPDGGLTCVRTGRITTDPDDSAADVLLSGTSGNFYWYGGSARGLSNAVFQLGGVNSTVLISGIHAERSRALLDSRFSGSVITPFPVMVESSVFETDWIDVWEGVYVTDQSTVDQYPPENDYGRVITFPYRGPLIVRNSVIGLCGNPDSTTIENASIGWTYVEGAGLDNVLDKDIYLGGFLFEGNALATTLDNPFVPENSQGFEETSFYRVPSGLVDYPCWRYPTDQRSNLSCQGADGSDVYWAPMPQHFTEVDIYPENPQLPFGGTTLTVAETDTSHELFVLTGMGNEARVARISHGVPGMVVVLTVSGDYTVTIQSTVVTSIGRIRLSNSTAFAMNNQDTLWLVLDADGIWQELGRSDN